MKRHHRIILLAILLILATMILSSCVHIDETVHVDETTESARYFLYKTNDQTKYLQFLENFDEQNYEMVNISISCGDDLEVEVLYTVTYRRK